MNAIRFFHWQVLRYLTRHRLLAFLNVLSIAAGVAVYLAVQLASQSASRAFSATIDLVAGKAQLEASAPAHDLPDELFPAVRETPGVTAATPLVRGLVTLADYPAEYLDVLGLDIFTNTPFRTFELTNFSAGDFDITEWLGTSDSIAVTQSFARRHNLHRGDRLRAQVDGREQTMRVGFIIDTQGGREIDEHFAAIDIGWAQELFGRRGQLDSIQIQLDPAVARERVVASLRARLPADVEIQAPARRSEQVDKMLSSFRLNLAAMSLVSLLVGGFLIFNTISASVVRRRREIGILRSLGVSRRQIAGVFLGEALALAFIGTLLGLLLGTLLARSLLGPVSETISSLYVLVSVRSIASNGWPYVSAVAVGLLAAWSAAILPARSAALMPPVKAMHPEIMGEKEIRLPIIYFIIGCVALIAALACSLIALHHGPAWISFLAAFFLLMGGSCFGPWIAILLVWIARALGHKRRIGLAALNFRRSLMRNSITVAALAAAVAMAIAVSVMIFSFRQTVSAWIEQTLVADLFVTPATNEIAGPVSFLPNEVIQFFASNPAVTAVDTFRQIEILFRDGRVDFAGIRANGPRAFAFVNGDSAHLMERFRTERCVIVSESFARRHRLSQGAALEIPTPKGMVSLPIAAVFYDYTRDRGVIYTNADNFIALFGDARVNSAGVYFKPGTDAEAISASFRQRFSGRGEYALYSNRALRVRAFEIFDQTFAVTYVLRAIAVIVAISGIFLSFTTLLLERSRIFGVMRAVGISTRQLRRMVLGESIFVGIAASILGVGSGLLLAAILTQVVNRAFFGWTIQLAWPWAVLAMTPFWILAAAIAAGFLPAMRAARLDLAEVLRSE